jgi:PII-like signaling protein
MLTGKLDTLVLSGTAKLSVFVRRHEEAFGKPAFMAICDLLYRRGLTGATVLRGVDGTVRGERKRPKTCSLNRQVPVMVTAIGRGDQIGAILPELAGLLRRPLLTLEPVGICKRDGELLAHPSCLSPRGTNREKGWQKLMVYASEAGRAKSPPVHSPLIRRLRESGAAGATSLRGTWGFHNDSVPHGSGPFQPRRVPMVTTLVDSPEGIAKAFGVVDELTADRGLVTNETVVALR